MPEDVNLPARTEEDNRPRTITCEFCHCTLSRRGEVLKKSAEAKALTALEEKHEAATSKVTDLTTQLAAVREEVTTLKQQLANRRDDDDDDDL